MPAKPRTRRGSATVFALCAFALGTVLSVSLLSTSAVSSRLSARRRDSEKALNIAEGGLHHAFVKLAEDRRYSGGANVELGDGMFSVKVTTPPNTADIREVECTASVDTVGGATVHRTVIGTAQVTDKPPMWGFSVFSQQKIDFKKGVTMDSGPRTAEGNVHTNGDVKLRKGVLIDGELTAVGPPKKKHPHKNDDNPAHPKKPKKAKDPLNGATVTGGYNLHADPMEFPQVSRAELKAMALENGEYRGDIKHEKHGDQSPFLPPIDGYKQGHHDKDDDVITLRGLIHGDVKIEHDAHVIIDGIVYVTGKVDLKGKSYSGEGAIIADKEIKIAKHENLMDLDTSKVAIVSFSKKGIKVGKDSQVGGGLYAPKGKVKIEKGAYVFGSVAGQKVDIKGGSDKKKKGTKITRNTDFQPPYLGHFVSVLGWREK